MAVADDAEKLQRMQSENKLAIECQYFQLGYTDIQGREQKIKVSLSLQSSQSHNLTIQFFFPQEEGNFVHFYNGESMTGLTWADNQPNNFDEQDCAMMEQNSSGIFDMSCSFQACPLCLLDISRPFQFSGLCQELQMDRKFLLLEVRGVGGCFDDI